MENADIQRHAMKEGVELKCQEILTFHALAFGQESRWATCFQLKNHAGYVVVSMGRVSVDGIEDYGVE